MRTPIWRVLVCLTVGFLAAPAADAFDEFNGSGAPNTGIWARDLGGGGFGNNELQCYTNGNANANQAGGFLQIQARVQASCDGRGYSSARIKTQGLRNFGPYGRIEARLQGPMGQGLWPAFWTLGSNITSVPWPGCGEIDIMEHINTQGNTHGVIHWNGPAGYSYYTAAMPGVNFTSWNNYAIDWNSSRIQWQVNGAAVGEASILNNVNSTEEFHRSMFIIFNLAVGGNWPGSPNGTTPFPANYNIDWVRFNGGVTNPTPTPTNPPTGTPTPTTPPGSGTINQSAWYSVHNRNSSKCVDARGSATANGTFVQQYTCNNSFAQHWQFQTSAPGFYRVNQRNAPPQVWDVAGVSAADGAKVHLWSYVAGNNQQWAAESLGGGFWRFRNRHSGKCLDVPSASTADSIQLQQWTCNGSNAQSFSLVQR